MEWIVVLSPLVWLLFGPPLLNLAIPGVPVDGSAHGVCFLLGILVALGWAQLHQRGLTRLVIAHHGHLCPRCRYNLDPTPTLDRCPECGTINNRVAMRHLWREHLHLNRTDLPDPPANPQASS